MFVWESVESLLEYAIAYLISSVAAMLIIKVITTFAIVTTAQTILKPLKRFLLTFIRKIVYKKGDDKVKALKNVLSFMNANKWSLAVILMSALIGAGGTSIIDVENLPEIRLGNDKIIEAVIQEEDLIATEVIYGKEAVIATETIYGEPIFATEVIYEKEPVYATEIIYEEGKEPVVATEVVYSKEPVVATKLTFVAKSVIYEEDGNTVKYNVGDYVLNSEAGKYIDYIDVFSAGDTIKEGTILYNVGDTIKEGIIKFNIGDVVEEGIIKYDIGDYMGNEILYNVGDVVVPAEILYNVGDVVIAKGTVIEEAKTVPATNITPYIYYIVLSIAVAVSGAFFESSKDYASRKELKNLKKEAQKEINAENNKAVVEEEKAKAEQKQKIAEEEKAKTELEKRIKLEKIKADIKAGNI
jgi:hypothetical protein